MLLRLAAEAPVYATFFLWLEWTKAARGSQWTGFALEELPPSLVGWLVFLLAVLVLSLPLALPLVFVRVLRPQTVASVAALVAAGVVWIVLSVHREISPTIDDSIVGGMLAAMGMAHALGGFAVPRHRSAAPWVTGGAMLAALAAVYAVGTFYVFDPDRETWVTVLPGLWGLLAGAALLALWVGRGLPAVAGAAAVAVALPLIALYLAVNQPWRSRADDRPNLVFIISDTLRADRLGSYGGPLTTPHLDALAASGVRFHHSYSLSPWTMPSMAGLFASTYPAGFTPGGSPELWLRQTWMYIDPDHPPTLAQTLEAQGYATGAFVANALVWSMPNVMAGFEDGAISHPIMLAHEGAPPPLPFLLDVYAAYVPKSLRLRPNDTTQAMNRYAEAWLRRNRHEPFMLFVHYIDPHAPYDPPERYRTRTGPWPFFYPYEGATAWDQEQFDHRYHVDEEDRDYVASLYDGEVQYVDEFTGALLDRLDAFAQRENTYICFTSDHGEELWDHGEYGHAHTVYNELMRVPLIFAGPDIQPRTIDVNVSGVDVMPTLFELMGQAPQDHWRGQSLVEALRDPSATPMERPVYGQATNNRCYPHPQQMVIDGRYKLIREAGIGTVRVYDLQTDPGEQHDIADENAVITAGLRSQLMSWLASFDSTLPAPETKGGLDPETVEQLRGMGYL